MESRITCDKANAIDLVEYLRELSHHPQKVNKNDYWYLSPLREERTVSFKVNRKMNVWYDHGLGKGGTLVDFGKLYYKCSVKEFLDRLEGQKGMALSFHPPAVKSSPADEKKKNSDQQNKIVVLSTGEITDIGLLRYLKSRQISSSVANEYCKQIMFKLNGKKHIAIGFKNDNNGYELRNIYFKGGSSPKAPTTISKYDAGDVAVFEGFFDFLSFQTIRQSHRNNLITLPEIQADFLILNSLSFFERSREQMEKYNSIHLFLDRDEMGIQRTGEALRLSSKYKDQSICYKDYNDLNECLTESVKLQQKPRHDKRLRL